MITALHGKFAILGFFLSASCCSRSVNPFLDFLTDALAIDGLQPDVGHEVLWVLHDCLSGEVLLVRSLLSACEVELASLLREVQQALDVPIRGVISDG